ncbi:MAG: uracil phosphoribosyltransferase [Longimicrobiales bacterium]|nr:uracil phosphoribosyltransferase [Longimicrobiales bacterium]
MSGAARPAGVTHPRFHLADHPLIQHKLSHLRDQATPLRDMQALASEITTLLICEATRGLETEEVRIRTPMEATTARRIRGKKPVLVPILRAGLGMVPGACALIPGARVGHVGLYRNEETLEPVEYYVKIPPSPSERLFLVLDPMLATGGSASAALRLLKSHGARSLMLLCLVAAPEGVRRLEEDHPDVAVHAAALDRELNERGYILPGLGDAGDRLFGTR